MPTYAKIVMFFGGGTGKQGWEEEWYWTTGDAGALASAIADSKSLVTWRRTLLGTLFSVEAARTEEVDASGSSFLIGASAIGFDAAGAGAGAMTGDCQNPWLALATRWYAENNQFSRNLLVRGVPDSLLCMGPGYTIPYRLPAKLKTAWDGYRGFVTSAADPGAPIPKVGQFMMRVISKVDGRARAVKVTEVAVASGTYTITTPTPIQMRITGGALRPAEVGDVIHVHGAVGRWARGLNGNHVITNLAEMGGVTEYDLDARQLFNCAVGYNKKAVAWGVNYTLVRPVRSDHSRVVVKSTGGPHFGTRGRRRVRC